MLLCLIGLLVQSSPNNGVERAAYNTIGLRGGSVSDIDPQKAATNAATAVALSGGTEVQIQRAAVLSAGFAKLKATNSLKKALVAAMIAVSTG
jgi:hypothetical protein